MSEVDYASVSPASREAAALLEEVEAFLRRYLILDDAQHQVVALWAVHTHVFDASDQTPYLAITSAEKGSGKSTVLDCLDALVARPERADSITTSALVRLIDAQAPTLLLDEADAAFGRGGSYAEALRGILNAGFRRGGVYRMSGKRKKEGVEDWEPERFNVFCPKAIAGIGALPETVASRSIPIRIKPKLPDEDVESFRWRSVARETAPLRERLTAWGEAAVELLRDAQPVVPEALVNRAADIAEPMLAIADLAGPVLGEQARVALVKLLTCDRDDQQSMGAQLLADIEKVFTEEKLPTARLLERLKKIEDSPWGEWAPEWRHLEGITDRALARLLKPYGVRPQSLRLRPDWTAKGYVRADFEEAFARYLPQSERNVRHRGNASTRAPQQGEAGVTPVTAVTDGEWECPF